METSCGRASTNKGARIALFTILDFVAASVAKVLILGLLVGHKWFISSGGCSSPEETINAVLEARENKDARALLSIIDPNSRKNIEHFVAGSGISPEAIVINRALSYKSMRYEGY